jgi:hypothetical protein
MLSFHFRLFPKSYPSFRFSDLHNTCISSLLHVYCMPIRLNIFDFTNDIIYAKQ